MPQCIVICVSIYVSTFKLEFNINEEHITCPVWTFPVYGASTLLFTLNIIFIDFTIRFIAYTIGLAFTLLLFYLTLIWKYICEIERRKQMRKCIDTKCSHTHVFSAVPLQQHSCPCASLKYIIIWHHFIRCVLQQNCCTCSS